MQQIKLFFYLLLGELDLKSIDFYLIVLNMLIYALSCAYLVGKLNKNGVRVPYTRKIFHFLIFSFAGILHFKLGLIYVMIFGSIVSSLVVIATIIGERNSFFRAMARHTDKPFEKMFILVPLISTAIGGLISNIFFGSFAIIGYFVAGWGDAIGEPVGAKWGRHKYNVLSLGGIKVTRSVEGSIAIFLTSFVVCAVILILMSYSVGYSILIALICSVLSSIVEAISSHGIDNLTMQISASATVCFLIEKL